MAGARLYPFIVSTLPWESRPGQWNLTVCLKATYTLTSGEASLAAAQDGAHDDVLFDQARHASLYSPGDFVPFKSRADVLLVGHAHAPGGVPVDTLVVRLGVGDLTKALRVSGDRVWAETPQGPRPSAPRPFTRMPLRYERAWRKGENLAGIAGGDTSRPPANIDVATEEGAAETPGFGPIAPSWRAVQNPRAQETLIWASRLRGAVGPAPAGLEPPALNAAPRDQQLPDIPPSARLVLDNLHPRFPRLEARLPSIVPSVFHVDPTAGPREVQTRTDTLWIDTDREVFVVSWRGTVPLGAPASIGVVPGRVLVAVHAPGSAVSFDDVEALTRGAPLSSRSPASPAGPPRGPDRMAAPFPLALPSTSVSADVAAPPIAGAPWAGVAAAPVPRPGKHLESTLPLGAVLPQMIRPAAPDAPGTRPRRRAPATIVLEQPPTAPAAATPFPAATTAPSSSPDAAPIAGAPWAGLAAAPVPRPDKHLEGTMPLGASLVEVVARAMAKPVPESVAPPPLVAPPVIDVPPAKAPSTPPPPPPPVEVVAPPPPPPPPVAATPAPPPPGVAMWRVDAPAPEAAPPAPAAPPAADVKKQVYGDFTRKKR